MSQLVDTKYIKNLEEVGCMTVGWILGKEGIDAMPVYPLAKALLQVGVDSSHLRNIVIHHESKIAKLVSPKIEAVSS